MAASKSSKCLGTSSFAPSLPASGRLLPHGAKVAPTCFCFHPLLSPISVEKVPLSNSFRKVPEQTLTDSDGSRALSQPPLRLGVTTSDWLGMGPVLGLA